MNGNVKKISLFYKLCKILFCNFLFLKRSDTEEEKKQDKFKTDHSKIWPVDKQAKKVFLFIGKSYFHGQGYIQTTKFKKKRGFYIKAILSQKTLLKLFKNFLSHCLNRK